MPSMYLPTCATGPDVGVCRYTVQGRGLNRWAREIFEVHQEPLSWAPSARCDAAWVGGRLAKSMLAYVEIRCTNRHTGDIDCRDLRL